MTRDPVCDLFVQPEPTATLDDGRDEKRVASRGATTEEGSTGEERAAPQHNYENRMRKLLFATAADICAPTFGPDPDHYRRWAGAAVDQEQMVTDPVCHMEIAPQTAVATRRHDGQLFYFCSTRCAKAFDAADAMVERLFVDGRAVLAASHEG